MKNLLTKEGFEVLPTSGAYPMNVFDPAIKYDINLDHFRRQPNRGKNHIMVSMMNQFGVKVDHTKPWLTLPKVESNWKYSVIHLTDRWRENSTVDWKKVYWNIPGEKYFIGLEGEWRRFKELYADIEWMPTSDVYQMAVAINSAQAVYCNQSVSLALSQSMGKKYFLERKPNKTNTLMYTPNENLL